MTINVSLVVTPIQVSLNGDNILVTLSQPYIAVSLANTGPQGPTGATGATGATGPAGPGASVVPITANNTTLTAAAGWFFCPVYNNTGSPLTIFLPLAPVAGMFVSFADGLQNAAAHNIIINGNGKSIASFEGVGGTTTIGNNAGTINPLAWDATNNKWVQFG